MVFVVMIGGDSDGWPWWWRIGQGRFGCAEAGNEGRECYQGAVAECGSSRGARLRCKAELMVVEVEEETRLSGTVESKDRL